ncbi:MAG: EAL domain-containing protein [Stagnimonas sp.]|nr:EAL domain-containing protein [Stagnimonas sp.]
MKRQHRASNRLEQALAGIEHASAGGAQTATPPPALRVLCVDDEPNILVGMRLQLRRHCELLTAASGAEGLEILRQQEVAVVISDMRMPGMDGAEFLRQAHALAPDSTRILLTGQADLDSAIRSINDGRIFRFLLKPCPPPTLIAALAAAASRYRLASARRVLSDLMLREPGDCDAALRAVFTSACGLFGCRHAALGRLDEVEGPVAVITKGLDPALFAALRGQAPTVLTALLAGTGTASRSFQSDDVHGSLDGLPATHPPVSRLLAVAFSGTSRCHGWMYFADQQPALPWNADDEQAAAVLGSAAALICDLAERRRSAHAHSQLLLARDDQLEYLSHHDPLTGLANRELFLDRGNQLLRTPAARGQGLGVMLLDLRHFRYLNDTLGRACCDQILQAVAERLVRLAEAPERVARVSGDRFAVLISAPAASSDPRGLPAGELFDPLRAPLSVDGRAVQLGATLGLSFFPDDGDDLDCLLCNAEAAMASAKTGGQRYRVYSSELGTAIAQRMKLEQRLRQALADGQFHLYYQPKIELLEGRICGAEALLRWRCPESGMISPALFVPVLEETGLIVEVGRWALRQAIADRRHWRQQGLVPPPVAVNVSPLQLSAPDFVETVMLTIGDDAAGIELEITESVLMAGVDDAIGKLRRLRQLGIAIAIDDFGTGYSSLTYLARLPLTALKIDRSFVICIDDSADSLAIITAIVSLAHALKLKVIAEGVERSEQLTRLRQLGCDEFQGFLFSEGLPAAEFARLLSQGRGLELPAPTPASASAR